MVDELIKELRLKLNSADIKVDCGRIRDERNPKNGGAWVAVKHPQIEEYIYRDGDISVSQRVLLSKCLVKLEELLNNC